MDRIDRIRDFLSCSSCPSLLTILPPSHARRDAFSAASRVPRSRLRLVRRRSAAALGCDSAVALRAGRAFETPRALPSGEFRGVCAVLVSDDHVQPFYELVYAFESFGDGRVGVHARACALALQSDVAVERVGVRLQRVYEG